MTTPYTPTGQVLPVDEITLPQDVIDLVVVETVNNPLVASADNTAWLLLMLSNAVSVKNFGALGNGLTDDTAAIQAALDRIAVFAGGYVFFPYGDYRVLAELTVPENVTLIGVEGSATITKDHATNHWFNVTNSTTFRIQGLRLEAAQANTGRLVQINGSSVDLIIDRCTINANVNHYHQGQLTRNTVHSVSIRNTIAYSRFVSASSYWLSAGLIDIVGACELNMAPAAGFPMVGNTGGTSRVNLDGVSFSQVSTVGGISFVDASTGETWAESCKFLVDDSGAGLGTSALKIGGGGVLHTANNGFEGCAAYEFGSPAGSGSDLQTVRSNAPIESSGAANIPDGLACVRIVDDGSVAPDVTLPNTLCQGQALDVSLFNGGVSTWSAEVEWKKKNGTQALTEDTTVFAGLAPGESFTLRFAVVEIAGALYWQQVGKVAVLV